MKKVISIILMFAFYISGSIVVAANDNAYIQVAASQLNEFETENLKISRMTDEDVESLAGYFDLNIRYYFFGSDKDFTQEEILDNFYNLIRNDKNIVFTIKDLVGNPIGEVDFDYFANYDFFLVSYWIAQPFWGNGYAKEACCKLIDEVGTVFPYMGFRIYVDCNNKRSVKTAEKIVDYLLFDDSRSLNRMNYTFRRRGPISYKHIVSNKRLSEDGKIILDISKFVDGKLQYAVTRTEEDAQRFTYKEAFETGECSNYMYHYIIIPLKTNIKNEYEHC